jgi:hypothetical protein
VRGALLALLILAAAPAAAQERFRVDGLPRGDALTIRERPDAGAPPLVQAPPNARLRGFGCTNATPSGLTWCRVRYDGVVGWARRRFLAPY